MANKVSKILLKVFGSRNERLVKVYSVVARQAEEFEEQIKKLDDERLRAKTAEFKAALKAGARPEDILPEAFAVVREVARRNVDMRHFDVQLIGGNVLYDVNNPYRIENVPIGSQLVWVYAAGFKSSYKIIEVLENQEVELNFTLPLSTDLMGEVTG